MARPACLNLLLSLSLSLSLSSPYPGLKGERHPGIWVGEEIESGQKVTLYGVAIPLLHLLRAPGLETLSWSSPGRCVGRKLILPLLILAPTCTEAWVSHLYPSPSLPERTEKCFSYWHFFFFFFGTMKRPTIRVDPVSVLLSSRRSWLGRTIQRALQSSHLPLFLAQAPGPPLQTSYLAQSLAWSLPPQSPNSRSHTDTRTQALYRPQNKNDEIVLFPGVKTGDWSGKGKRRVGA